MTHEVLPAIRRHGGYLTEAAIEEVLSDPDTIIRLATDLKEERTKRAELTAHVADLEPKASALDRWLSGNTAYSVDLVAKALRQSGAMVGRNRLFTHMHEELGWIFKQSGKWMLKQWCVERGLLVVRLGSYENDKTGVSMPREY